MQCIYGFFRKKMPLHDIYFCPEIRYNKERSQLHKMKMGWTYYEFIKA